MSRLFIILLSFPFYLFNQVKETFAGFCYGGSRCLPGMEGSLADTPCTSDADCLIGKVAPPPGVLQWITNNPGGAVPGLIPFLNALIQLLIVLAGLYTLFNLIMAGYGFMSAGGDPKGIEKAWAKIWQSLLGLLIIAASFLLAAIFGWLLFKDPGAILNPRIISPGP